MTHGRVRYFDIVVIDAILVRLNLSENYHMGIYYYSTCFICADISWLSELLPQSICWVTEGFFLFCLVVVLLWSNEACRRNKQKNEGKNQPRVEAILLQLDMSHMRRLICISYSEIIASMSFQYDSQSTHILSIWSWIFVGLMPHPPTVSHQDRDPHN